jgi:hypothetical protein
MKKEDLTPGLQAAGYHEVITCGNCKFRKSREQACGTQSFVTIHECKKVGEPVYLNGTCNKAKAA